MCWICGALRDGLAVLRRPRALSPSHPAPRALRRRSDSRLDLPMAARDDRSLARATALCDSPHRSTSPGRGRTPRREAADRIPGLVCPLGGPPTRIWPPGHPTGARVWSHPPLIRRSHTRDGQVSAGVCEWLASVGDVAAAHLHVCTAALGPAAAKRLKFSSGVGLGMQRNLNGFWRGSYLWPI